MGFRSTLSRFAEWWWQIVGLSVLMSGQAVGLPVDRG